MLVDAIQRLGIDYHFQEEIEAILLHLKDTAIINLRYQGKKPLFDVSLCFRLLRQGGYNVSADVFNQFKDKEGNFNNELSQDIRGLMELFEATQLNLEGEDILYEAANFCKKHLIESLDHLDETHGKKVRNILEHPYHRTLSKFMAKRFLKEFKGSFAWIKPLQELARMEFIMAQCTYREEVSEILRWWNDIIDLLKHMKLVRDQPIKWYAWIMAALPDTSLSELRVEVTKSISFIYIIDDIFDIYGEFDQLTLFTEAINRWEFAEVDQLPDYMKICFKTLYDVTNEIGSKIYRKYGHNPVYFLQKTWENLCNAYLVEAKWFASGHHPKADEYLKIAAICSGVDVVLVHVYFLLGLDETKETAICLNDIAGMTSSVATILRLWNDLGGAKDGNQDGHDGSYIDYYVQEHGVTDEFAQQHVMNMISNEWKQLNKESLRLNKLSENFTRASQNIARVVPLMYNYEADQSLPLLETYIKSVLYDDLSLELD